MVARRLDHPGCDRQRLLFQDAQNLGSLPTAQPKHSRAASHGEPAADARCRQRCDDALLLAR
jgi:hypothetical protein